MKYETQTYSRTLAQLHMITHHYRGILLTIAAEKILLMRSAHLIGRRAS